VREQNFQNQINTLHASRTHYKKSYFRSLKKEHDLNKQLLAADVPIDGPLLCQPCNPSEVMDSEDIRSFVTAAMKKRNPSPHQINSVISSLGLDTSQKQSYAERHKSFTTGLCVLIDYHFQDYATPERADLLGELMFNIMLFGKKAGNEVATKVTRSVTSSIFSSVALLRSIDSHGGALNDTGCDQYAKIEEESGLTNTPQGYGMLHKRWKITEVRAIANDFVNCMFNVKHVPDSVYGDYVEMDLQRCLRFQLKATGMTNRAVNEGFEIAVCADGAEICGKHKASQTCVGLKPIDLNSVDVTTNEPLFTFSKEDEDGIMRMNYKNMQSKQACHPVAMCLHNETTAVIRDGFGHIFRQLKDWMANGIPVCGNEPALKGGRVVCTGDMSMLMKALDRGGGCKVKALFCHYCECNGELNMWNLYYGEERCRYCVHNERYACPHREVNTTEDLKNKAERLLQALLDDHRRTTG